MDDLNDQIEEVQADLESWPEWMRELAYFAVINDVD